MSEIPGFNVRLDPNAVTRVEISKGENEGTLVSIFLRDVSEPRVFTFPTKQESINFYGAVWQLRSEAELQNKRRAPSHFANAASR